MSTQLRKDLYIEYAEAFDSAIRDSITAASDPIYAALTAVVNIQESDYPEGVAADIEVALLPKTNVAWDELEDLDNGYMWTITQWTNCAKVINNYVIENDANYIPRDGDNNISILTNWVNNLSWESAFVPYYWERLSKKAGYDTSDWIIGS